MITLVIAFCSLWMAQGSYIGCSATATGEKQVIANAIYGCSGTFGAGTGPLGGVYGTGANSAAALCSADYHVCNSAIEAESFGLTTTICRAVTTANEFFATKETSDGNLNCYSHRGGNQANVGVVYNDIWGCGGNVFQHSDNDDCGALISWYGNARGQNFYGWNYQSSVQEAKDATLTNAAGGGVLCCRDSAANPCENAGRPYEPGHECQCQSGCSRNSGRFCNTVENVARALSAAAPSYDACPGDSVCCCSCSYCDGFTSYL